MTLNPDGFPLSAAVSPRLHVIETVDSTNAALVRDATADPAGHPHLSVVLTRDQRAGRGRLDRTWITPPGSAVAVSVLLRVKDIPPARRPSRRARATGDGPSPPDTPLAVANGTANALPELKGEAPS